MTAKLFIVRGLPGSGKSTYAKNYIRARHVINPLEPWKHFEADMYHIDWGTGEYVFNPARLKAGHEWCHNQTMINLQSGINVIVTNTFVKKWEYEKYTSEWENHEVLTLHDNYGSIHNVPMEKIEQMRTNFEHDE